MEKQLEDPIPTVVLLLDRVRRVGVEEARRIVRTELGDEAADTVRCVMKSTVGMSYIDWRLGATTYHLGTSSEPYLNVIGEAKLDANNRVTGPFKLTMRGELPPDDPKLCDAWMSHCAWLYVDAILLQAPSPEEFELHRGHVFRVASHLVDERCVLLWRVGGEPKRFALPSPQAVATLRQGHWHVP